jgi:hypothetical protein
MHTDMLLPADDAERTSLLAEAMALAEHCRSPVTDAALDAAMRTVLTRHHCAPVFPFGLAALVDALDGNPRPSPPDDADEDDDDADDTAHTIRLLRQGEA